MWLKHHIAACNIRSNVLTAQLLKARLQLRHRYFVLAADVDTTKEGEIDLCHAACLPSNRRTCFNSMRARRKPLWTSPLPADPPTGAQVVGHGREVLAPVELGPVTPRGAPGWLFDVAGQGGGGVGRGPAGTARPPEPEVSVRRPAQRPSRSDRGRPLRTARDRCL